MKQNIIKKLSDREHILQKSGMYVGSKVEESKELLILEDSRFQYRTLSFVPGLLKIIDEIIDNSVDEAIRTNFQFANNISIDYSDGEITISDNGRGVPITPGHDNIPQAVLAFTEARAGSNFSVDTKANGIGTNGVGSYLTNVFSKKFTVQTQDGKQQLTLISINNAEKFDYEIKESKLKSGTQVRFKPDYEFFGVSELNESYFKIIKNRLFHLAQSFPKIKFTLNKEVIKSIDNKKYIQMFNDNFEIIESEKYFVAITPNEFDDFRQFSYVNGLNISSGGSHIDLISNEIVGRLKEKLEKKYKTIKPGDIKNKIMVITLMNDFPDLQFDSQTKERVKNSVLDLRNFFGEIDWDKFGNKVFKNDFIINPITEVYKIKEELKKRQELASLDKKVKKIKSDKYFSSIGTKKYLVLCEGESAFGGISPVIGRKEFGYYILKGVPLNAYATSQSKFTTNTELSELYKIIQNENYENIIIASDQDLDGYHIRGLLLGFFEKYLANYKDKIGVFNTPVIGVKKNNKLIRWSYNLNSPLEIKSGETSKYFKGLGSWKESDLKEVIQKDGISNMIQLFEYDNLEILNNWLSNETSDKRKEYILENEFNIAKI